MSLWLGPSNCFFAVFLRALFVALLVLGFLGVPRFRGRITWKSRTKSLGSVVGKNIYAPKINGWNLKFTQSKRKIIFQTSTFGFKKLINFPGCVHVIYSKKRNPFREYKTWIKIASLPGNSANALFGMVKTWARHYGNKACDSKNPGLSWVTSGENIRHLWAP